MTERDFGRALLHGEHPVNVEQLTRRVLRRDRRRMWFLATLCVVAWMLVVMLPWSTVLPMMTKIGEHLRSIDPATPMTQADRAELAKAVRVGTIATFICSLASMLMAAVCTVGLIILSRRATLRQVNARLAEISDQLRAMAMK
jgi:ABC-type Fe3+ transport system permease subunit